MSSPHISVLCINTSYIYLFIMICQLHFLLHSNNYELLLYNGCNRPCSPLVLSCSVCGSLCAGRALNPCTCSCSRSSFCSSTSTPSLPCLAARKLKKRLHLTSTSENWSYKPEGRMSDPFSIPRWGILTCVFWWMNPLRTPLLPRNVGAPGQSS